MVCAEEAQEDIGKAIGVQATMTVKATWANNLSACPYEYAQGTMRLSVKELSEPTDATSAYFSKLQLDLGWNKAVSLSFGDGAFLTTNGSVVVRKDDLGFAGRRAVAARSLRPAAGGSKRHGRSGGRNDQGCWR